MRRQKLTLSVDPDVIARAKAFAGRHRTSVSELVTQFLRQLGESDAADTPVVSRLRGLLPADASREEHRAARERKYWP